MRRKYLTIVVCLLLFSIQTTYAQYSYYQTKSGKVPLFFKMIIGDINATTHKASSNINLTTGEVQVKIPIASFEFRNPFVATQFKSTYMEMEKYPETIFKGKFDRKINLKTKSPQRVQVHGTLNMHGVTKRRTLFAIVNVTENGKAMKVTSVFSVTASEHKINVPKSAFQNGNDRIEITLNAEYEAVR